jgi:hypothetical protein
MHNVVRTASAAPNSIRRRELAKPRIDWRTSSLGVEVCAIRRPFKAYPYSLPCTTAKWNDRMRAGPKSKTLTSRASARRERDERAARLGVRRQAVGEVGKRARKADRSGIRGDRGYLS